MNAFSPVVVDFSILGEPSVGGAQPVFVCVSINSGATWRMQAADLVAVTSLPNVIFANPPVMRAVPGALVSLWLPPPPTLHAMVGLALLGNCDSPEVDYTQYSTGGEYPFVVPDVPNHIDSPSGFTQLLLCYRFVNERGGWGVGGGCCMGGGMVEACGSSAWPGERSLLRLLLFGVLI